MRSNTIDHNQTRATHIRPICPAVPLGQSFVTAAVCLRGGLTVPSSCGHRVGVRLGRAFWDAWGKGEQDMGTLNSGDPASVDEKVVDLRGRDAMSAMLILVGEAGGPVSGHKIRSDLVCQGGIANGAKKPGRQAFYALAARARGLGLIDTIVPKDGGVTLFQLTRSGRASLRHYRDRLELELGRVTAICDSGGTAIVT